MALVYSERNRVKVCVDKFEITKTKKRRMPTGNFSYYTCQKTCQQRGKRLLTHLEWKTACLGTNPQKCNINRDHPVLRKQAKRSSWYFKKVNCKKGNNAWKECLKDPSLNKQSATLEANKKSGCKSKYGVYNMVGNLGEWVDDNRRRRGQYSGRFNGGLYPQKKSSCSYSTTSHHPSYADYSIGCRCGKNV